MGQAAAQCSGGEDMYDKHMIKRQKGLSLAGMNTADVTLFKLIIPALIKFPGFLQYEPKRYCGIPYEPCSLDLETQEFHGSLMLVDDEDVPPDAWYQRFGTVLVSVMFDVQDTYVPFENDDEGEQWIADMYGDLWPSGPEYEHVWRFDNNDDHEHYAFFGLAAHLVRKIRDTDLHVPDDARYVVDVLEWYYFGVREGFERLGAAAYFNSDKKLTAIWISYMQKMVYPSDPDWEHAKYTWRSTVFVHVSLPDHVIVAHLRLSTALVSGIRGGLPPDHPLRRMLKPFTFRSAHVNGKIVYRLGAERGLLSRAAALPDPELLKAVCYFNQGFRFEPIDKIPERNGMADEDPTEYGFVDVIEYAAIVRKFVTSYLDVYYQGDAELLRQDEALRTFVAEASKVLSYYRMTDFNYEDVVELITQLIVGVTGYHEHAGTVAQYLTRPVIGAKVRRGMTSIDQQGFAQVSIVGCVTGIKSPRLMNDWTYLLLQDAHIAETTNVLETFQAELAEYNKVVEERNARRPVNFTSFYPELLEVAVSV